MCSEVTHLLPFVFPLGDLQEQLLYQSSFGVYQGDDGYNSDRIVESLEL